MPQTLHEETNFCLPQYVLFLTSQWNRNWLTKCIHKSSVIAANKVLSEFLSVLVHRTELINNRYPLLQTDGVPEWILICMRVLYVTFFVMKFTIHEEVVLWKQFSNSMHFAPGIRRCLVDSPHKWLLAQWFGDLFDFNPSKLLNKQWSGHWAASPWNSCDITSLQCTFT